VVSGASAKYAVRVTNRGNATSKSWKLELAAVPSVPEYDGSGAHGAPIGSVAIPDGVAPGESVDLTVNVIAPAESGEWLVKSDIVLADGSSFADMGVAPLQNRLTTTAE
jgi:hypothetical protein